MPANAVPASHDTDRSKNVDQRTAETIAGLATRRQVLAFLALADAPIPDEIHFDWPDPGLLSIEVGTFAAADAWCTVFGSGPWPGEDYVSTVTSTLVPFRTSTRYIRGWRGWDVRLCAKDPCLDDDSSLDADTREQLAAVAVGTGAR